MTELKGNVRSGKGHFTIRMTLNANVFETATGEKLYPGTINVEVDQPILIREDFRIKGIDVGEPNQDFLFEKCKINGINAYRIRPYDLATREGGHGDHILEILSSEFIPECEEGNQVTVALFRDLV